jgi:hypothetical protein
MQDQQSPNPNGLWDKKTYASAFISALLAGIVALTVCAFRGETLALGQTAQTSVSNSHTATSTGLCLAKGN